MCVLGILVALMERNISVSVVQDKQYSLAFHERVKIICLVYRGGENGMLYFVSEGGKIIQCFYKVLSR